MAAHDPDPVTTQDAPATTQPALGRTPDEGRALTMIDALSLAAPEGGAEERPTFDYAALEVADRITVQQLTREIRDDLEEVERRGIRMGQRLLLVRERLSHRSGAWLIWLRVECPAIGRDTAENLLNKARLAAHRPNYLAYEARFDSTALTKLAKPNTPQSALDEAERRAKRGERVSARDAEEIIRAAKAGQRAGGQKGDATVLTRTERGMVAMPILLAEDGLALHHAVEHGAGFCISHIISGMAVPRVFISEGAAATALHLLAALDWTAVEGATMPPALAAQIRSVLGLPPASVSAALDALRQLASDLSTGRGDTGTRTVLNRLELEATAWPEPHCTQVLGQIAAIRQQWGAQMLGIAPTPPANWRQVFGAAGSGRWVPIVPYVLLVEPRLSPYEPAPLVRMEVLYETDATVRVQVGDLQRTVLHTHAYCLPSDTAWIEIDAAHAAYGVALTSLAGHLRALGRYHNRLEAAGGFGAAPNPLTASIISCPKPDERLTSTMSSEPWRLPTTARHTVVRHTAKMLYWRDKETDETPSAQDHFTVCPDDAAWAAVQELLAACAVARDALLMLLTRYGTVQEALANGRHTGGVPVAQARAATPRGAVAPTGAAPTATMAATDVVAASKTAMGLTSGRNAALDRNCANIEVGAHDAYTAILDRMSDDQLALVAAVTWSAEGTPWYAATRATLAAEVLRRWMGGIRYEIHNDGDSEATSQVAYRVGVQERPLSPAAAELDAEIAVVIAEEADPLETGLQRVETLLAQSLALPPGCEAGLQRVEALLCREERPAQRAAYQHRINVARVSLHDVAVRMGLAD